MASLPTDSEVASAVDALKAGRCTLKALPPSLRAEYGVVREAVSLRGADLKYACRAMRGDLGIASLAVDRDGLALEYVPTDVKTKQVRIS